MPAILLILLLVAAGGWAATAHGSPSEEPPLLLSVDGIWGALPRGGRTVGDALRAAGLLWTEDDLLVPDHATPLQSVHRVYLTRARRVTIRDGNAPPRAVTTYRTTVGAALADAGTVVRTADRVTPAPKTPLADGATVTVTRVREDTRTEIESLPAPREVVDDPTLPLGAEITDDPGMPGEARLTVHIRTENGRIAERTVDARAVLKAPRPRRVRRGTKVVVLDAETGRASWYGGAAGSAAHRSLPFGTRLRVVHARTGASTVVRVRDRGPFLPERVVDLSRDAYAALAPLGTGTIPVRVERLP